MMAVFFVTFPKTGRTASMRIDGMWSLCDDGILRPVIRGEIRARDHSWLKIDFLVDTGADRTVLDAETLDLLRLQAIESTDRLSGVGGLADSVLVATQIRFDHDEGGKAVFKGQFAGFTSLEALDMSVLGRDISNMLSLIVDRQGDTVCLVGQPHHYIIGKR